MIWFYFVYFHFKLYYVSSKIISCSKYDQRTHALSGRWLFFIPNFSDSSYSKLSNRNIYLYWHHCKVPYMGMTFSKWTLPLTLDCHVFIARCIHTIFRPVLIQKFSPFKSDLGVIVKENQVNSILKLKTTVFSSYFGRF